MPDLIRRLEAEIAETKARMARLQTELAELETAARVIRRYQPTEEAGQEVGVGGDLFSPPPTGGGQGNGLPAPSPAGSGPVGTRMTVRQYAIAILGERGPMHFKELAEEAVRRGFHSVQSNAPGAEERTFTSLLYRDEETFEQKGRGVFALRNKEETSKEAANEQGHSDRSE
jgi:hypothetical protein